MTRGICIDYKQLNKVLVKNRYPMPHIDDFHYQLRMSSCYKYLFDEWVPSTEDYCSGHPYDRIKTHYGHYEFLFMSLGLTNAPTTLMDWWHVCSGNTLIHFLSSSLMKYLYTVEMEWTWKIFEDSALDIERSVTFFQFPKARVLAWVCSINDARGVQGGNKGLSGEDWDYSRL